MCDVIDIHTYESVCMCAMLLTEVSIHMRVCVCVCDVIDIHTYESVCMCAMLLTYIHMRVCVCVRCY